MRVLFISRSYVFDGGSSLTNVPKAVLGEMLRAHDDLTVTWVLPRNANDHDVHLDVLAPLEDVADRLIIKKIAADGFGRMMGYYLTDEMQNDLRQVKAKIPYDLILNQHPALTMNYRTILANRYRASRANVDVPIVNWHLWTATLDQLEAVPEYYVGTADIAAETMGAFFAEANVWESDYLLRSHKRTLNRWLAPYAVRQVMETSSHIHVGISYDEVRSIAMPVREEREKSGEGPTLFWGGRFANQKKAKVTLPLMRDVAIRNPHVRVRVTTSHHVIPDWATEQYPDWWLEPSVNREKWFNRIGHGDVFLCNSVSEGYGSAWLEMLAAGQLGVFERMWWLDGFLPDWYPFIADSHQEQVEMASALLKQWPDGELWKKYVPMVQEWLHEEHNAKFSAEKLYRVMKDEYDASLIRDEAKGRGTIGQLASSAAQTLWDERGGEPIPAEDVWGQMGAQSEANREWGKDGDIVPAFYLRKCLLTAGWRDLGEPGQVRFVKAEGQ